MSEVTEGTSTNNQLTTNYDVSKIFIWGNRFKTESYNNATYDPIDLLAGTVMGRVAATGKIVALDSAASNGSQFPVGVLNQNWTIADGETQDVSICDMGDVAEEKLIFTETGDDLDTIVDGRQLRDHLAVLGIKVVPGTELTDFDNQ